MDLKDKKVLVVGMAKSGIHTVKILNKLGAKITVNDIKKENELGEILSEIKNICSDFILGKHPENIDKFDLIILSPGVPTDIEFVKRAKEKKIPIIGELELAYRLSKGKYIAITGTNGKTTTTALTGEIFKSAGFETFIVGNIGIAAISKALETDENSVLVTEVSSFQLETIKDFKPKISAILNITPDHLNRHKTMENYIEAKTRIFMNQNSSDDIVVLNYDNIETRNLSKKVKCKTVFFSRREKLDEGVFVENEYIVVKLDGNEEYICKVDEIYIPGNHNLENALAAVAISYSYGIKKEIMQKILREFKGVEHRLEFVDEIDGIKFYNDSKGTNPDASIKAIEALKGPLVLIAGGMDKGSSFDEFIDSFKGKVKTLILLGETSNKIKETAIKKGFNNIFLVNNMQEAVTRAFNEAQKNDIVLLSPACASWDMYKNFEYRGRHFKDCVYNLRRS
ncbi:UDP-N-acetylmuramoylalanine--D-glutamate ligase [Caminicella sporogenes DSM 14501]|uniref:UDP-N-acetylmuramoylalanine--D-glutamate ligase n=1 Tax=Caminicella sporogenes DSM 14501 TaxID=1121266 RepID=A0A1M6L1H0_9FIRM|nr:UDP-N-acetylmuramoyl-L-alanine--D-glutamate ligase [Caminicella sporogenes]RKD27670.1 UDP-N-acetylmuramoylalanine--D-glutamate ligase [Caminicella sporogenes]SHJ64962.1 UDP-N-acetylmuramoylalanine--D-glutamate ligase [Caminicella sporogenes DSM 14501]